MISRIFERSVLLIVFILISTTLVFSQTKIPPSLDKSKSEPVIYNGKIKPVKQFYDGLLPHAVGVHQYQAFRANRQHPSEPGVVGWTYNHQPYLAYWNGKFYLEYLSGLYEESAPPTRDMLMTSVDGRHWSNPVVVFPEYNLPEIHDGKFTIPAGTKAVMHQRMAFYIAPNGKLLVSGFYGYAATPRHSPNSGNGLGRVVREIHKDGTFGPVYFIRYNRHAGFNESNTTLPFYKTSKDKSFLVACNSLLHNKLITLQWWEEDRSKDGFYPIDPSKVAGAAYFSSSIVTSAGAGKAFDFYHRPDGVVVGMWKNQYSSLSPDNGKTWTKITRNKTLWTCGAKTWGQRTDDGRYAIVLDYSATRRNRFPLVALVGEDGHTFNKMYCISGQVPPERYQGIHKNTGPQYVRGIIEGNGNPPGTDMWLTYSVNKEDIWVASVRTPIGGEVKDEVNQNFENISNISQLGLWNLYIPKWAPITIEKDLETGNKYMDIRDEDPYDYAEAERIFPKGRVKEISFSLNPKQIARGHDLEIEVQNQRGARALKLRVDEHWLSFDIGKYEGPEPIQIHTDKWYAIDLKIDCAKGGYNISVNGKPYGQALQLYDKTEDVQRIVFRTGPYRNYVDASIAENGTPKTAGLDTEDLPGSGVKAPLCEYLLDNLVTKGE